MNLFKRKRCCKNLIKLNKGNLTFREPVMPCYWAIQELMKQSGNFDERLYFDLYREYEKHYMIYDMVPDLLRFKVALIFNHRFPNCHRYFSNNFTFQWLIPNRNIYSKIPDCLCLPVHLEEILVKVRSKILPYIIQNEIDDTRFLSLIRENFLKQWDLFNQDNSQIDNYMDAQFDMMYGWASIENQTIVKNIIERTQDELAQEFLSKNDTYGK